MADDDVPKYEVKSVRTMRGLVARTKAKWQEEGWEFVAQNQSLVRTEMTFRRVKTKRPWYFWAAIAGGVLIFVAIFTVGILTEGKDGGHSSKPAAASTPEVTPSVSPTHTQHASPTAAPIPGQLDETTAAQFLAYQWEAKFTYGGTVHWIESRITTVNPDGTLTFKIDATVKNAYGTDEDATIEGDVGGTDANPIITDSILYFDDGTVVNFKG